jgi:hypothetical protein
MPEWCHRAYITVNLRRMTEDTATKALRPSCLSFRFKPVRKVWRARTDIAREGSTVVVPSRTYFSAKCERDPRHSCSVADRFIRTGEKRVSSRTRCTAATYLPLHDSFVLAWQVGLSRNFRSSPAQYLSAACGSQVLCPTRFKRWISSPAVNAGEALSLPTSRQQQV